MGEKFNLTWHSFSVHGQELFMNLLETEEFSDVTLVSDDLHQYKVHKFILSACSTVFKTILTSTPPNSSVYLRGINHEELESILQFIYLGEATFYQERANKFLNLAKDLQIKEISKLIDEDSKVFQENQIFYQEDLVKSHKNLSNNEENSKKTTYKEIDSDASYSVIYGDKKLFQCQQCDYKTAYKGNLDKHVESKHESISYPFQQCDYQATRSVHLQAHIQYKHEGIRYPCQQCDYQATTASSLTRHMKLKHIIISL